MYDLIVIGGGPGGYCAAIRGAQLGMKTALVEKADLGGVCLNWGCIPTKALLKSASVYEYAKSAAQYGVEVDGVVADLEKIVERSRGVVAQVGKGIEFLIKKNGIDLLSGFGRLTAEGTIDVDGTVYQAKNVILATGARPRQMASIPVDGERVITSRQALALTKLPSSMVVIGSGAIGVEFASFYSTLGTKITVIEYESRIAPREDAEISATMERSMRKAKMTVMTNTSVEKVEVIGEGCQVTVTGKKGEQVLECDMVLSAVGITPNIENIGLEEAGVATERGRITVDEHYQTSVKNVYAIGDVINTPALAHVASAEAIHAVEHIAGLNPKVIDYGTIPSCVYTTPEISSVGMTEQEATDAGFEVNVGKFPFTASGKAIGAGARDGFAKLVFDKKTDKLLGAHFIGLNVTEMIGETTLAMALGATARNIIDTIHAHPTIHEGIMEAAAAAHGEAIHL